MRFYIRFARARASLLASACMALGATAAHAGLNDGTANGDWRYWGGDEASTRYAPLDQINADNFDDLEIAWRWKGDNYGPEVDYILRATPLYVKGKLYAVAGQRRSVVSIDPATGETLWMWRMKDNPRWQKSTRKNYGKGVAWASVNGRDLHLGLGDYPVHPDRGIGDAGDITSSSPPIVVNGVIVVGNSHDRGYYPDAKENVPGHIRGYDAATGRMLWRFNVVPAKGEFGRDTWEGDSADYTGNVSAWAPLSADSELGLVYVVTDTPTNDYYGGDRLGDNLYGTSILALDVKTGERRWHFQMVHHDVWNLDNPNAPKLLDVKMGRRTVPGGDHQAGLGLRVQP